MRKNVDTYFCCSYNWFTIEMNGLYIILVVSIIYFPSSAVAKVSFGPCYQENFLFSSLLWFLALFIKEPFKNILFNSLVLNSVS